MAVGRVYAWLAGLGGAAATVAVLAGASAQVPSQCSPASIGLARTIEIDSTGGPKFGQQQYQGNNPLKDHEVILTFDDGPHKAFTPEVLSALDAHCTKATFFMVGQRAMLYPELVRAVASRGHSIGTHTWSHQNLAKLGAEAATTEIELGISAVQKAVGAPAAPFFRFPYLAHSKSTTAHLVSRDTGIFSIDVDSYDFKTRSPTVVIRNVMRQLETRRHGIILFHDIQPSTAGALNTLLSELKSAGYKVVHMIPKQGQAQTTVAEFDRKAEREFGNKRLAALPVPVAQRAIVAPAWDAQVSRGPAGNPAPVVKRGDNGGGYAQKVPSSEDAPPQRPTRRPVEDDWRSSVFRSW